MAGVLTRFARESAADTAVVVGATPVAIDAAFLAVVNLVGLRLGCRHSTYLPALLWME